MIQISINFFTVLNDTGEKYRFLQQPVNKEKMTLMKGAGHALGTGNSIIKGPAVGENLA